MHAIDYSAAYARAVSFTTFLRRVSANRDLWEAMARRAPLHEAALERVASSPGQWRLLVLADDWCGDAVNTLPGIARLADAAPNLELRVLGREDIPEIMDRHLTKGARAIPIVILVDENGEERGWWGPRPRVLQSWFDEVGRGLDKDDRYLELRRWYARDRGKTTAEEIATLVSCAAIGESYRGTRPCSEERAA